MPESPADNDQNAIQTTHKPKESTTIKVSKALKSRLDTLRLALQSDSVMDTNVGELIESLIELGEKHRGELSEIRKAA